jgi:hypothetical protein
MRPDEEDPDLELPSPFQGEGSGMRVDPPDPSLLTVINNRTILAAWTHAMAILELDIRRETYQTYLAPTYPKKWISPGILVITAPTPYIRDWLTDRLTSTLSRLMCGILAQPISLLFECSA